MQLARITASPLMSNITTPDSSRRRKQKGVLSLPISDLVNKNNNSISEKDLLNMLRKELYERGSPASVFESPVLQDFKKAKFSSTSDPNLADLFRRSSSGTNIKSKGISHERVPSMVPFKITSPKLNRRSYHRNSNTSSYSLSNMTFNGSPGGLNIDNRSDYFDEKYFDKINDSPISVDDKRNNEKKITDKSNSDIKTLADQFYSIQDNKPIKQDAFRDLEFIPFNSHIIPTEEMSKHLINIDSIIQEHHSNTGENDLEALIPMLDAIKSINQTITHQSLNRNLKTFDDINALTENLQSFSKSICQLSEVLQESSKTINQKYKPEIKNTIDKLNDFLLTLENLEFRLNKTKLLVGECKDIISNDIYSTIQTLEYINSKFSEYSNLTRRARLHQLVLVLALLVIIIAIYINFYTNL